MDEHPTNFVVKLRQRVAHARFDPSWVGFFAVLLLIVPVSVLVARTIWVYRDYPFDADEAIHANKALAILLDLRAGDLGASLRSFYRQGFYPPAFAVPKAATFLIFGASPLVARFFSLVCLFAAVLFVYGVGLQIDRRRGWMVGFIGAGLTLTSQPLLVASGLVMMETPGLLAGFAMLWLYLAAMQKPAAVRLAGTSLLLLVNFLTKYTYGLPAVATVVLMELSLLWPRWGECAGLDEDRAASWPRGVARRWSWLFVPFLLAVVVWFVGPGKLDMFLSYATAQPEHWSWTLDAVIFYPRSIALHCAPSPLFAVVTLIGVVWAVGRLRDPKLRLLLIYFCAGMGEMFFNFPKNPRFIVTFVPAAHLLTGAMIVWGLARWRQVARVWRGIVALLLAASLVMAVPVLTDRFRAYPSVMEVEYETNPQLNDLAAWIQSQIPPGGCFYVINFWDQFDPQALAWYLGTHDARPGVRFADVTMPSALLQEPTPENIAALREDIRASGARYVVSFEGTPWGEPVWWLYADALGDVLAPAARDVRYVDFYSAGGWLKRSLLRRDEWERVKAESRYTLQVQTTVYTVAEP
jgi:hypothetical protein